MDLLLLVAVAAAGALLATLAVYNGLAFQRQEVRDAWGRMDEQLRCRYDLLPALVALVRATGEPEPPDLSAIQSAKNRAAVAFNPQQLAEAETAITTHLRSLLGRPPATLAGAPGFAKVRADLLTAQSQIERAARQYNEAVEAFNLLLASFPHDVVAAAFGFKPQPAFELRSAA